MDEAYKLSVYRYILSLKLGTVGYGFDPRILLTKYKISFAFCIISFHSLQLEIKLCASTEVNGLYHVIGSSRSPGLR